MILYDKFMNNDAEMCSNNTLMNPHNTVPNYYSKTSPLKKSTIQKFIIRQFMVDVTYFTLANVFGMVSLSLLSM